MEVNKFIQIPNNVVWDYSTKEEAYIKRYGDKVAYVITYLQLNKNIIGYSNFTIEDIITTLGLTPKRGEGKINEQVKTILIRLYQDKIIDVDVTDKKINEFIKCKLTLPFKIKEDRKSEFFNIKIDNFINILNDDSSLDKVILINIYYYINARLHRRNKEQDIRRDGGVAEACFSSNKEITADLMISESTLTTYLKKLKDMGLIFYANIGNVKKDNKIHEANNMYVVNEEELEDALAQSTQYYKENGYKILKKTKEEIKVINGLMGKIKQEHELGNDITKLEDKLNKLEKKKDKTA